MTKTAWVVEKVLELISSGAWKSGYRLPSERELSEAFGVSRTVVREVIKALEARGVLESATGSGVSVRRADFNMVSRSLQTYMQSAHLVDLGSCTARCDGVKINLQKRVQ